MPARPSTEQSPPPPYTPEEVPAPVPVSAPVSVAPNFAEEIARRRMETAEPVKTKPPVPVKPVKPAPAKPAKPEFSTKPEFAPKPVAPNPLAKASDDVLPILPVMARAPARPVKPESHKEAHVALPQRHSESPPVKPVLKPKPQIGEKPVVVRESVPSPTRTSTAPAAVAFPPPAAVASPPPPPPRNYLRAAATLPPVSTCPPVLDLELATGWYMNSPLVLPKALVGLNYSSSYQYSTRTTPFGAISEHTREMTVRLKDLARLKYKINWKNSDATTATSEIAEFLPSPILHNVPSKPQLVGYSQQYGEHVAAWCVHKQGEQVGSGECWDLAHEALLKGCGKHAFVSTYYHHGFPILEVHGSATGPVIARLPVDEIRKGDVLQFKTAVFKDKTNGSTQTAGDPDHTSVVIDKIGEKLIVAEQNVQGVRTVRTGECVLGNITEGSVVVYRPVPAEWAEPIS